MGASNRDSPDSYYIVGLRNNQNSWRRSKDFKREVFGTLIIIKYKMCLNVLREYLYNQGRVLVEVKKSITYTNQDNNSNKTKTP